MPMDNAASPLLRQMVQTPEDDFLATVAEVMEGHDSLDAVFAAPTVEDDIEDAADPFGGLNRDEMELIMQKFERMRPEVQKAVLQSIQQENPDHFSRITAAMRMLRGRDGVL